MAAPVPGRGWQGEEAPGLKVFGLRWLDHISGAPDATGGCASLLAGASDIQIAGLM